MTSKSLTYLKVNLWDWICGAIAKINPNCTKKEWDAAWLKSYFCAGGKSRNSGTKDCPKNAAYCLYKLGRIKGSNLLYKAPSYTEINKHIKKGGYGKNGCYSIIAYDLLITEKFEKSESAMTIDELWEKVKQVYRKEIKKKKPADSNQGAVEVTFKLFHNDKLNLS